ncbi:protein kinase [Balamuthia mandrillaris]
MQRHRKKSFSSSHLPKFTLLPPSPQLPEAVTHILESLSLERYIPSFSKEEISEKAFFLLTENDLIRMGLPIGPRKLILDYVFEANNNGHGKQKASKENEIDKTVNPQRIISSSGEVSLRRPNVTLKNNASSSPSSSSSSSSSDSSTAFSCSEYPSSKSFSSFESSCLHYNSSSSTLSPSSSSYDSLLHRRRFSDSAGLLMNVTSACSPSSPPAIGLVRLKAKRIQRKQQLQQQQEEEEAKPFVGSVKMTHDETVLSVQKKFKATQQRNKGTDERKHDKGKEKNREDEGDDDDNSNIEHEKKAKRLTLINLIPGSKKKEKESHRKHKGKDEEAEQHKKEKKKKKKKKKKKCKKKKQQKAEKSEQVEEEDKEEVKAESTVRPPSSIFLNLSRKYAISDDDDELERERRREQLHRTLQRRRKSRSARADSPSLNKRVTAAFGVKKEEALRGLGSEVKSPVLRLRTETKYVPFSQAFLHLQQHQQEDECDHEEKKKADDVNEETEEEEEDDEGQEEITIPAFRRECHYSAMPEWNTETKEPSTQAPPKDDETEENVIVSSRRMIRPDLRPELFLSCAQSSASSSSSNKSIWQKSKPKAKEEEEEEGAERNYGKIPSLGLQDGTTTSNNSTNKEELLSTSQNGALIFFLRGGRSGTRTSEGINIKKRTVPLIGGSRNKEAQNDEVKRETERQRKIVWQKRMIQQWAIDYDELELIEEIGYGSFGVVWKAKWRNSTVVVKKFFFQTLSKQQLEDFLHESMIMMTLRPHANVVQFLGVCLRQPNLCLVSEYIPDGDLLHLLRNNNLFLRTKLELALGIAAGMTHLHKENIVHCDLSARNCLVTRHPETREYSVKLTDFGMAIGGVKEVFVPGSVFGPLKWMSVEAIDPCLRRLSKESDVWSFGVVAWELLTNGKEPFEGMTPEQAANAILSGRRLEIPSSCPEPLEQLIESCWQEEPTKRPTFQQIYASLEELLLSFPSPPLSTAAAQRRRSTASRRGTLLPAPIVVGKTEANNSNTL